MAGVVRGGGPIYLPTSVNASVGGDRHAFAYYKGPGGVSLHPLQRAGVVGADSHSILPAQGAPQRPGLGGGGYPAAKVNMQLPPVLTYAGSPRDGRFQVA